MAAAGHSHGRDARMTEATTVEPGAALRVDLRGRRALVTGGSRGIAAAIARGLARAGAAVAISYAAAADARSGLPDAAAALVEELKRGGTDAVALEADLARKGEAATLAAAALAALGSIDILVLSASVQVNRDILEQTEEDIALQLQVNLVSAIQVLQVILPAMRAAGHGRIITIGSVQESAPNAMMPVYAMTKAAQVNLVHNLALQNAAHGITVNNVAPGLVRTDRNAFRRADPAEWATFAATANPMGRACEPEDIAGAVLFLASDAAAFVTGATIKATGGAHIPWVRRPQPGAPG
jgi:NAD(P)-dependent dehydrogenase (short-subunit alcohol dehydrogenase family)